MSNESNHYLDVTVNGSTRAIAYRQTAGQKSNKPGIFWLNGFCSNMLSTKVTQAAAWSRRKGLQFTQFDYSGHGDSGGKFEDGSIGDWLQESQSVFDRLTNDKQLLIGSSMGGWLAMRLLQNHLQTLADGAPSRIGALVLIAPALDLTESLIWQRLDDEQRLMLERDGYILRPDQYGDAPIPITNKLIQEGRNHIYGDKGFAPKCPVRILHGRKDDVVPWRHGMKVLDLLHEEDIRFTLIKDGDHRLSNMTDIHCLLSTIEELISHI